MKGGGEEGNRQKTFSKLSTRSPRDFKPVINNDFIKVSETLPDTNDTYVIEIKFIIFILKSRRPFGYFCPEKKCPKKKTQASLFYLY